VIEYGLRRRTAGSTERGHDCRRGSLATDSWLQATDRSAATDHELRIAGNGPPATEAPENNGVHLLAGHGQRHQPGHR